MIYTHQDGEHFQLRVIRSGSPSFSTFERVRDIDISEIGAWSVDMVSNPSRDEFVVVGDIAVQGHGALVRLVHYDMSFNLKGYSHFDADPGFQFGEGVGIVTNPEREIARLFQDGEHAITFVAATHGQRGELPRWIVGPTMYATFKEGHNGVVDGFSVEGFDVGFYNPHGWDGNFYIHRGDKSGIFGDQTAWHWGVFPTAEVISGDFNRDGRWDIGLANPLGDGRIFFQHGDAAGSLVTRRSSAG